MDTSNKSIIIWLYVIASMIILMIIVGGLTRLTGSGLSITVWAPISGAIPPLSTSEWISEFNLYKQIPQYKLNNYNMTLEEFKVIYWWEWSHRQLGRIMGVIFIIPLVYFWIKDKIPHGYKLVLISLLLGGAFQGFLGWFMVASGLSQRTEVSQYRLALHLGFAVLLYIFVIQTILCLQKKQHFSIISNNKLKIFISLIFLQIISGAFMAGTHSGYIYNTWPLLDGSLFPLNLFPSGFISLFEDHLTIQFFHRLGAYIIFIYGVYIWQSMFLKYNIFLFSVLLPVILGIITLVTVAPIEHIYLASIHQISAIFLLTSALFYNKKEV